MRPGFLIRAGGLVTSVLLASCSPQPSPAKVLVKELRILQSKVEIVEGLRTLAQTYEAQHPNVRVVFETVGGGLDYSTMVSHRFSSAEPPAIFMNVGGAQLEPWLSRAADLSNESWVSDLEPGAAEPVTRGGHVFGFPLAVEGFGFVYQVDLFTQAGIGRPPTTFAELHEACARLRRAGIRPFANSYAEWWTLGYHFLNALIAAGPDQGKFEGHPAAEAWFDLLDLTIEYGQPDPTTTGTYASSLADFLAGRAAMTLQGNWIQPDVDRMTPAPRLGLLPVPVGPSTGSRIMAGVPNFLLVVKGSPVESEARRFLAWLIANEDGRRILTDELKVIPPFQSFRNRQWRGLNKIVADKVAKGAVLGWYFPQLPSGAAERIGATLIQYASNNLSRKETLEAMDRAMWEQRQRSQP